MSTIEVGKPALGYVVCLTMPDGAFIGGALITDSVGLPVEFRHTEPVVPTKLQRILYGKVLEAYMANDVVMGALLSSIQSKPDIYLVPDIAYLQGADGFGPPALWISSARNVPVKEAGARHDLSDEEYVLQLMPGNGPVRIRMHLRDGKSSITSMRESSSKLLLDISNGMDLIEPLHRVEEGLHLLWEEGQKNSHPAMIQLEAA